MAHSNQAKKRIRQNVKHRLYNRSIRTRVRKEMKKFLEYVSSSDFSPEEGQKRLAQAYKVLDTGWSKGVYKRNTISRYKSRLARELNQAQPQKQTA